MENLENKANSQFAEIGRKDVNQLLFQILETKRPTEMLERILSKSSELLQADAATIVLWKSGLGVFNTLINIPPQIPLKGTLLTPDKGGLDGRILRESSKKFIQLTNYSKNMDAFPPLKEAGFQFAIGGRINIQDGLILATVCFYFLKRSKRFNEEELRDFPIILSQIGIAILNAYLYQKLEDISILNKETTNFMDLLINSTPDIIINTDLNGKIKLWNRSAEEILGFSSNEVMTAKLPLKEGENEEKFYVLFSKARKGESIFNHEILFKKKKNKKNSTKNIIARINLSLIPVYNQQDVIESILLTGKDLSEEHILQEKVNKINFELNQKNIALLKKEKLLYKTKKELDTAEKFASIGTIIERLNHQINNPLMGLLSLLSISIEDIKEISERFQNKKENIPKMVKNLQESLLPQLKDSVALGYRINEVLKHVRFFSEVAKEIHFRKSTNLVEVINQTLDKYKEKEFSKQIEIKKKIDLKSALIYGNFKQLQFVIDSLIENAIKAIELNTNSKNKGIIEVNLMEYIVNKRRYYRMEISDNGIGLTQDQIENLFDPFYINWPDCIQMTKTQSKLHVGLSLAIVKLIMINHNGYIDILSKNIDTYNFTQEEIKGTKFILDFPSL
ncbi:MAG: PAS domain-containing protein [Candidatus Lokiarchaeota archaeon]|nr:PAS domain-containing protein [Candidatus Harpocratesius repetitus]